MGIWHDIFHMFDKVLMHVIARLPPLPTTFDTQFDVQFINNKFIFIIGGLECQ